MKPFKAPPAGLERRLCLRARKAVRWCCPALLLALAIATGPAAAAASDAETTDAAVSAATATLSGQVRITRKLTSQRMRFRLYPSVNPQPPSATAQPTDEKSNIVIYLEQVDSYAPQPRPEQNPAIRQEGETFLPHVLPIVKGTTVEFPNLDPIFHNVFSLSGAKSFDLGRYPQGDSRSVTFDQPGVVPVFCHLHSDMSAIILVLDNPFFAVPDAEGNYRIDHIPPGTYTLVGWHERSERTEKQVTLQPGEVVELDILIPIEDDE